MEKVITYFEQVPLDEVRTRVAALSIETERSVTCHLCSRPLSLEKSKTDENGRAVHGACYFSSLKKKETAAQAVSRHV